MEIGERLKEAREAKGLSLDSLQETTKIQKRYLQAIELGNFHILPGKFYARAFIKEYAAAVGLDANELLEEYKDEIPRTEDESSAQYTQISSSRKDNNPPKGTPAIFSLIPTIIVILLIIGIVFAAWYFIMQNNSSENSEPVEKQDSNEIVYPDENDPGSAISDQNKKADEKKEETDSKSTDDQHKSNTKKDKKKDDNKPELKVVEKGTGASPKSTLALNNAGNKVNVTLEPSGDSWVELKDGNGKTLYSGLLTSDDDTKKFDLSDAEKIYLNIGSAPSLTVKVNGVKVEYPVNPEEKVHQYLWINIMNKNQ
ncbi:helix-turn-helix domain-containing protein [Virgibacillus siamensis]|uniref:helix-turn-helix domain-containing protein n=1 Tax=Virgibacillus siamensis TaxID=480071 RepID=UPI0009857327|nr:helix-turn-helix domain-containing protein [Virgibacillus siamensis]